VLLQLGGISQQLMTAVDLQAVIKQVHPFLQSSSTSTLVESTTNHFLLPSHVTQIMLHTMHKPPPSYQTYALIVFPSVYKKVERH